MKLSAPIYRLKRQAVLLSREAQIPHHEALDRVAQQEGFSSWGLLAAKLAEEAPASRLYSLLKPGDLLLIAARPGHGKTLMSLELALEAMKNGLPCHFFTLEYSAADVLKNLRSIHDNPAQFDGLLELDDSDSIHAAHIINRLQNAPAGTFVVIDYLQLLDQNRTTPDLVSQVQMLKAFAQKNGLVMAFISQIHRSYDPATKPIPDLADVRLPNPLDLSLFDKACFLNEGAVEVKTVA